MPEQWIRRDWRGNYRGQKQIWYLLRLVGRDCDVCLRASEKPEFDAWRWNDYWVPMEAVIEFKREVYQKALNELARYLHRRSGHRLPEATKRAGSAWPIADKSFAHTDCRRAAFPSLRSGFTDLAREAGGGMTV